MQHQFPASRLQGKPLTFRSFLTEDYVAEIDGLRVGWILRGKPATAGEGWWWTMIGPSLSLSRVNHVGQCHALQDAKNEFQQAFDQWLTWALQQPGPITWFGTSAIPASRDRDAS